MAKKIKGIPDEFVFGNLLIMTPQHKEMLGKHLITIGYKLVKDKSGKTVDDVIADMKNVFINLKKLKEHYESK